MNIKQLLLEEIGQTDILSYYNASVTYIELPMYIRGFVHYYKGIYDILINRNISYYKKKKTLLHELAHIELNQLCQVDNDLFAFHIQEYEDEADRYIELIKESIKEGELKI